MVKLNNSDEHYSLTRPNTLFPVTRHLSYPLTVLLVKLPVSPNQITALSLFLGLTAAWFLSLGTFANNLIGANFLIASYTLDNCDGEIARLKNLSSKWGAQFDDLADWLVDSAIFTGLGYGVMMADGEKIWLWLGLAAAAGATVDYIIDLRFHAKHQSSQSRDQTAKHSRQPEGFADWLLYIFHKLSQADFCLIVFSLTLFDVLWILLPLGAIGAQAYWVTDLFQRARGWHT